LKRALITGVAGFLGSHLAERLLKEKYFVDGIDNLITGNISNIDHLINQNDFNFIQNDLLEIDVFNLNSKYDLVFHAASPASPPKYFEYPFETLRINAEGTIKVAKFALKNNARLIYFSTSEIYGDPEIHPQPEDYWGNVNPIGPRSVYDESKRYGEAVVSHFKRNNQLNAGIIRIFNTYGPRLDKFDGRVISNFLNQAIEGVPLTIYGDGNQTRSFCFVSDLIEGIWRFSQINEFGPINLGNDKEISLNSLFEELQKITGNKLQKKYLDKLQDDPQRRRPDLSKAKELLDWSPSIDLLEGLQLTLNWYKNLN
jgi:nucleoside-diphosphate-sugar epimerase